MLQADSLPPEPPGKSLRLINYPEKISIHYKVINLHKYLLLCARPKDTKEDEINTKVTHSLLGPQTGSQTLGYHLTAGGLRRVQKPVDAGEQPLPQSGGRTLHQVRITLNGL